MKTFAQFSQELSINIVAILSFADRCDKEYHEFIEQIKGGVLDYANADIETRMLYHTDVSLIQSLRSPENEAPIYRDAIYNPYFMYCIDPANKKEFYISDKVSLPYKSILKYTSARAGYIRYHGDDRMGLKIEDRTLRNIFPLDISNSIIDINSSEVPHDSGVSEKKSGLSNIADTLIDEQDSAMRSDANKISIIVGPAGSGKTNALIHKMDYLISECGVRKENLVMFCFNVGLKNYLQSTIKSFLGENISVFSLDKWMNDFFIQTINIGNLERRELERMIAKKYGFDIPNNMEWQDYNIRQKAETTTKNKDRTKTQNEITSTMNERKEEIAKRYRKIDYQAPNILSYETIKEILNKDFGNQYVYSYKDTTPKPSVVDYVGLYKEICTFTAQTFKESDIHNPIIRFLLVCYIFKHYPNLHFFNIDTKKPFEMTYEHIFLDEFQDLSKEKIVCLKETFLCGMTIAGDPTQSIFTDPKTKEIDIGFQFDNLDELTVSHRGTRETVRFANALLLKDQSKSYLTEKVTKVGEKPIIAYGDNFIRLIKGGIGKYPNSTFLIACPNNQSCEEILKVLSKECISSYFAKSDSWDFTKQVHISTYQSIKGLEFDFVFVLGLEDFLKYGFKNEKNVIYTVLTRARNRVILIKNSNSSCFDKLLGSIDEDLYVLY